MSVLGTWPTDKAYKLEVSVTITHDNLLDVTSLNIEGSTAPVPEPGTVFLIGAGLVGIIGLRRRTKK